MSAWSRAAPLIISIVGFVAIGALWLRRALAFDDAALEATTLAAGLLYGAWLLWESRVSAREMARAAATHDRGTMEVAAAAKLVLLVATLAAPSQPTVPVAVAGLLTMLAGILLRAAAIRALGAAYSHRIRTVEGPVVEAGPYRAIRHPAYAGTLLAHAGLVVAIPSVVAAIAFVVCWLPAVVLRTHVEDRVLMSSEPYLAYAKKVPHRLLPKVY